MKTKHAKIDGVKKDFDDKAKKNWYAKQRNLRFSKRFGKGTTR